MSTDTPETDKLDPERHDMIEHARRLERERDWLKAEVERLRYIIERDTPYAPKEDKP